MAVLIPIAIGSKSDFFFSIDESSKNESLKFPSACGGVAIVLSIAGVVLAFSSASLAIHNDAIR